MKSASCLVGLSLLLATATAHASPVCPPLPPASGLQWNELAGADYLVCKAMTADGRQVVGVMLTTRDPDMALARDRRAEKGQIRQEEFYWYKLDLGGNKVPGMESRRVTVVELGRSATPNCGSMVPAPKNSPRCSRWCRTWIYSRPVWRCSADAACVTALRTVAVAAWQRAGIPGALQTSSADSCDPLSAADRHCSLACRRFTRVRRHA